MKIKAVVWQEDGVWCASVPNLPGCHTWGDTYEHAQEMLKEAVELYLEGEPVLDVSVPKDHKICELSL